MPGAGPAEHPAIKPLNYAGRCSYSPAPYMQTPLHRIAAWFCVVVTLLSGAAPMGGLVLCIEADGCVNLEAKAADASCAGCHDHDDDVAASAGTSVAASGRDGSCPCIDVPVPGMEAARAFPARSIDLEPGSSIVERASWVLARVLSGDFVLLDRTLPFPRAPESLTFLRTIVLCV